MAVVGNYNVALLAPYTSQSIAGQTDWLCEHQKGHVKKQINKKTILGRVCEQNKPKLLHLFLLLTMVIYINIHYTGKSPPPPLNLDLLHCVHRTWITRKPTLNEGFRSSIRKEINFKIILTGVMECVRMNKKWTYHHETVSFWDSSYINYYKHENPRRSSVLKRD